MDGSANEPPSGSPPGDSAGFSFAAVRPVVWVMLVGGATVVVAAVVLATQWHSLHTPSAEIRSEYAETIRPALVATDEVLSEYGSGIVVPELANPPLAEDLQSSTLFTPDVVHVVFRLKIGDYDDTVPPIRYEGIDEAIDSAHDMLVANGHSCSRTSSGSFSCYSDHWLMSASREWQLTGHILVVWAHSRS